MKSRILFLSLALMLAPSLAVAQAPPNAPPDAATRQQFMRQMADLHEQARLAMLGALSQANRSLLATVAGDLVASDQPDIRAAAERLDASLSPTERDTILDTESKFNQQARALHEQMAAAMGTEGGPPPEHPMMPPGGGRGTRPRSAGLALLRMTHDFPLEPMRR